EPPAARSSTAPLKWPGAFGSPNARTRRAQCSGWKECGVLIPLVSSNDSRRLTIQTTGGAPGPGETADHGRPEMRRETERRTHGLRSLNVISAAVGRGEHQVFGWVGLSSSSRNAFSRHPSLTRPPYTPPPPTPP